MTPNELVAWRGRLGLTQTAAAAAMGITKQTIWTYEKSRQGIPLLVELATEALERRALADDADRAILSQVAKGWTT